jgi:hypothetical protein
METNLKQEALELGYKAFSNGYNLRLEQVIFDKAISQLEKNDLPYLLVPGPKGVEIWREKDAITMSNNKYQNVDKVREEI